MPSVGLGCRSTSEAAAIQRQTLQDSRQQTAEHKNTEVFATDLPFVTACHRPLDKYSFGYPWNKAIGHERRPLIAPGLVLRTTAAAAPWREERCASDAAPEGANRRTGSIGRLHSIITQHCPAAFGGMGVTCQSDLDRWLPSNRG
jgi:hypothetical protein